MRTRSLLRYSLAALAVVAATAAFPSAGHAITFDFTSDHCSLGTGCIPDVPGATAGTVTLTQNGANVDFTVELGDGYSYVKTGAGNLQAFKFNGVGVALGDIIVAAHDPVLAAAQAAVPGGFDGDGTGQFTFGIGCPSCGNGGAGAFSADIFFTVNNATIADLTQANNLGNIFAADVLFAGNGATGMVDVTAVPVPGPIVGAGIPGLILALTGMLGLQRFRRRRQAA
jgi:hypothetical protein